MKFRIIGVLFVLTLIFTGLGMYTQQALAAGCSGLTCEGKSPDTMGCSAVTDGPVKWLPSDAGTVETRKSTDCNARWARTYNRSGSSRYAAADIRCGANSASASCQPVSSPGKIASSSSVGVFTPMTSAVTSSGDKKYFMSCGSVQPTGPISVPITPGSQWCTGTTR
jgi:hypothetical protein